jgi:hypothetical protein
MTPELEKYLKAIGITTGVILGVVILYAGFTGYKTYLETVKLKLDIHKLKKEL